ncbi:MAG: type II toxin-antitoxin system ParD family antitoxin [Cocleimonas sp.]
MNISLPDSLKDFAQSQTKTDNYSNPSDYVRSLIREDKEKKEAQLHFESLLLEGLNSGEAMPVNREYWETKKAKLHKELTLKNA